MSSPFFGQEHLPTPTAAASSLARPLRKYSFIYEPDMELQTVEAHYTKFESGHISFWVDRPEHNVQDTLVLAELNANVLELREVLA